MYIVLQYFFKTLVSFEVIYCDTILDMPKKNILIVLAVILVVAGGAYVVTAPTVPEEPSQTGAQGKIDINAVCEGALAYMSFPDGASAELYVTECKEGKHPEVIERYKADMNLGAGAEI